MSAAVIQFTGERHAPTVFRTRFEQDADVRALRDARLIRDAKVDEGDWLQAAFLAMLRVMGEEQRRTLEGVLTMRAIAAEDKPAEQAAAIIRFRYGRPDHCQRVVHMLTRMEGEAR